MPKSKLLFLVQLPPPVHGAALRNKFITYNELLNKSFNIEVLPLRFARDMQDLEKISFTKLFILVKFMLSLTRKLFLFKPDIVYFTLTPTGKTFYRDVLIVAWIKLFSKKLVYHLRVLGIKEYKGGLRVLLYKYVFRHSTVISLSYIAARDLDAVHTGKLLVVNNGIEDPVLQYNLKLPVPQNKKIKNILFLSNLFISKGILDVVEAIALLKQKREDFHLNIVGKETRELSYKELEKIIETKGLRSLVTVKKALYGADKFKEYLQADIFVFPTYYPKESFPGVIIEAMSCQLPIVATKAASIPEMVDPETGILVNKRDIASIALQLERLLQNPKLRADMGIKARRRYLTKFSLKSFEKRMLNTFQQLTKENN